MADFNKLIMEEKIYTEKDLRTAFFGGIKVTEEGNYPNIDECFKEEFDEWLEEFKKEEFDEWLEDIKTINNEINRIEKSQILDDEFSVASELELIKLKKLLTNKINKL